MSGRGPRPQWVWTSAFGGQTERGGRGDWIAAGLLRPRGTLRRPGSVLLRFELPEEHPGHAPEGSPPAQSSTGRNTMPVRGLGWK